MTKEEMQAELTRRFRAAEEPMMTFEMHYRCMVEIIADFTAEVLADILKSVEPPKQP